MKIRRGTHQRLLVYLHTSVTPLAPTEINEFKDWNCEVGLLSPLVVLFCISCFKNVRQFKKNKRQKTINQPDQGWCWSSTPFLGFAQNHPFPSPLGFQVSNQHHCWFGQRCQTDHAEYLQRYPHCSCFWFDSTRTNQRTVKLKRLCLKNVKYPTLVFCTPMQILSDVETQPLRRILDLKFGHKQTAILEICNKIYIYYIEV